MYIYLKKLAKLIKKYRSHSTDKTIKEIFLSLPKGLTLLDIGAAGGIQPRWGKVGKQLNYIGVEPDERSNKELENKKLFKNIKILNKFAWNKKTKVEFNLCKTPTVSSAYKPNRQLLNQFPNAQRFDVIKTELLQAEPLFKNQSEPLFKERVDREIDFIKLDIQGGELNALKGLGDSIDDCLGMEIEVEFSEMYKSQPLFGDVHSFLKNKGFYFCDFVNLCRWERDSYNGFGRCMFGDGLWLRELKTLELKNSEAYLKYAAICAIYGKINEALHSIQILEEETPAGFREILLKQLKQQKKERKTFDIARRLWNLYSPRSSLIMLD